MAPRARSLDLGLGVLVVLAAAVAFAEVAGCASTASHVERAPAAATQSGADAALLAEVLARAGAPQVFSMDGTASTRAGLVTFIDIAGERRGEVWIADPRPYARYLGDVRPKQSQDATAFRSAVEDLLKGAGATAFPPVDFRAAVVSCESTSTPTGFTSTSCTTTPSESSDTPIEFDDADSAALSAMLKAANVPSKPGAPGTRSARLRLVTVTGTRSGTVMGAGIQSFGELAPNELAAADMILERRGVLARETVRLREVLLRCDDNDDNGLDDGDDGAACTGLEGR
jgi:hypothetical protein